MTRTLPTPLALIVLAAWLLPAGPAQAVYPPPVKDDGKFFTKEGLEKANKKIREIYEKYRKDVVVETLAELTEEQKKKMKDEKESKFFVTLALARLKELGVNGIYIVISKNPRFLQIEMDPGTRKTVFTNKDRQGVREKFFAAFREMKFDEGLLEALDAIEAALKAKTK
jgi:uncharacterized membrane protein YgcG